MIFTPAYAQDGGAAGGDALLTGFLIPMGLIFIIMYFLIIRPQQKRAREHNDMLKALRRGDEVITQGGIIAKVTKVIEDSDEVEAEIAPGTKVRLVRATISGVKSKTEPAAAKKA
ncbi:MAG: preprotein translocase subunit YajC [Neomegalonema sp.]|nr:preprotein translocase subunit YajC [Neomegalonema sp.]